MDKAQELPDSPWATNADNGFAEEMLLTRGYYCAQQDMLKAGYRKLPEGEPPLLSGEEIIDIVTKYHLSAKQNRHILARQVAQAQRDSDLKWMK